MQLTKKNEIIILFLKVLFLSNRTLLSKIFMLVVLKLSFLKSLFELISESNNVILDLLFSQHHLNSN
jgi:hypothetical protein